MFLPAPRLGDSLFYIIVMKHINVALELLDRFSSTKRMKELLAVAIWMKMQHSNSVVWNVSSSMLRKTLRIGDAKAKRLIGDMRDCELFSVSGNIVVVSSFRDHTIKYTRKGKAYKGAMVCKIEVKDYSLKELYNLINEKLYEFQICAAEHKDCLLKEQDRSTGAKGHAITTKQFRKAISMSAGSVVAIKKRLIAGGKISSSLAERHSFDMRNGEETKRTLQRIGKRKPDFVLGDLGYVVLACRYSIEDRKVSDGFRHLVYGKQKDKDLQKEASVNCIPDGFFA